MDLLGLFVMGLGDGHADVEGREHGEDEGLDVGHQTFEQADEDAHEDAHHRDTGADAGTEDVAEDEDEGHEAENHDVACRHVGEESYHQHDGLGEDTDDLDQRHEREYLEPGGDAGGVEDVHPIVLVAAEVGDDEGDEGQGGGDGDIAGDVGASREEGYQAQDVAEEDKEEEGEQVGQVLLILGLADHGTGDAVAHKDHQQLDQSLQHAVGRLLGMLLVARADNEDDDYQQHHSNHDGRRRLGDAQVEGLLVEQVALVVDAHYLLAGRTAADEAVALVVGVAVMELGGHEDIQVAVVDEDDGQRDGNGMLGAVLARIV